jgi:hypothetical protein
VNLVYLLDVNVYEDADETVWCDGVRVPFETQASALAYFDAWIEGAGYAIHRFELTYGAFVGDDTKGFDRDGKPVFMSWGINAMEVRK